MRQAIHLFNHPFKTWLARKTWPAIVAKLRSNKRLFTLALLLAAIAAIGTTVFGPRGAHAQSGSGGNADYSSVRNALAGFTHFMRQDDIVVKIGAYTSVNNTNFYPSSVSAITTADSSGTQNFDPFEIPRVCDSCSYSTLYHTQDTTIVTGRFFHTLQDTAVSYPSHRDNQDWVEIMTGVRNGNGNASFQGNTAQPLPYGTNATTLSQGYAADFNGDGFDDLLMTFSDYTWNSTNNARLHIATANDINDPSQGFNYGAVQAFGFVEQIRSTAIGDFNGDGQPDIAVLRVEADTNDLYLAIFSVDHQTLTVSFQEQALVEKLTSSTWDQPMQLVAGKFTGGMNQQVVVANQSGANNTIKLRIFDFAEASYQPVVEQTWDSEGPATNIKLLASKYDWGSPYDVISFMQTNVNGGTSYVNLLTVDPGSYAVTKSAVIDVHTMPQPQNGYWPNQAVALDIAVGNFNNQKPNPVDSTLPKLNDPDLQLAVALAVDLGNQTNGKRNFLAGPVEIIQVTPLQNGSMSLAPLSGILVTNPGSGLETPIQNLTINAADLQGRSLRLGNGYKISIEKNSPTLILAQPPLHVDWVPLDLLSASPTVLNLSFAPNGFNSTYTTTDSTNNTSNSSKTTGWGFSGKESDSGSLTLGETDSSGNLENGVKISYAFTAQQDLDHSLENTNGTSVTTSQTIAQTTGSNDVVWNQDGITYLYVYEVIGQTICPSDKPDCQESERVPLTIMMSAPGPTTTQYVSAEALEWYQPVWENGNVLSYPATVNAPHVDPNAQLFKFMDVQTKAFGSATLNTDGAGANITTTWTGTQSRGQNVSYSQVFKEDSDINVEAAGSENIAGTGFGVSADASLNFDFGGSDSLSTLRTNSTTIESAQGMTINKNVNFRDYNTYGYSFTGVIFGKTTPPSYFDGTDSNLPASGLPPDNTVNLNIFGPMRSAFTVDPLANNQGGWWSHSYSAAPDVALNHPNRWSRSKLGVSDPLPSNCLETNDGYMDCAKQKTRQPFDPWDDSFHAMRGFFIFKAGDADPNNPYNQGLQQQAATAGDQLSLQARVYNYSLKAMPAGTQVKVRFYAMPWDTATALPKDYVNPSNPGGASFLIGETTLSPIQPWNNDPDTPNYSIASVNFDTTGHDNQDLAFWVAVWMQDASGNMVTELPGKGLTAIPGDSTTPTFLDLTNLEPTTTNSWKENEDDPATTSFSNNIGFYKLPFFIRAKDAQATRVSVENYIPSIRRSLDAVSINNLDVRQPSIWLGQSSEVHATLRNRAEKEHVEGLSVYFYDGDPARGGRLFDIERLAHIRAGADHKVKARFTPRECGMHQVFVKVSRSGIEGATGRGATQLRVRCTVPNSGDKTPPKLKVTLTPNTIWPPDGRMVPITAQIEVSDSEDPRPEVRLEAITHNEASNAKDDVAEAGFGTDDRAFLLRAKRAGGSRQGRIYEVVYSATDWAGNKTYVKVYVTVPHDKGR
jgi:hypothetical protein